MVTFLTVLFVIFSLFLALFILMQPGKGDMGLGGMGNQMLFGGSGGQNFFQKTTWVLCAIFMLGALGLAILKARETKTSLLQGFKIEKNEQLSKLNTTSKNTPINVRPQKQSKEPEQPTGK
jgi:protein translocase SecG subunit